MLCRFILAQNRMRMFSFNPTDITKPELHQYLLGCIAPRPIAFASTISANGEVNLAPFSFFNCFGSNPPTVVFSPARSGRSGTTKHTLDNVREVPECVINMVSYDMVGQMNVASSEYAKGVNEFRKADFTEVKSDMVKPPRVKESPAQLECVVKQIIETGDKGGAGNLIIAEIVRMHINEAVLDEHRKIDPRKIDLVARLGGSWYCRANGDSLFQLAQPVGKICIGFDALPLHIRQSAVFTGNELSRFADFEKLPSVDEVAAQRQSEAVQNILSGGLTADEKRNAMHLLARQYLQTGETERAFATVCIEL